MTEAILQAALLSHGSVRDCVVLTDAPAGGRACTIAYVISDGPLSRDRLDAHVRATTREVEPADVYVPVVAIPLDDEGGVDEASLLAVAVIDDSLLARCQTQLTNHPGVEDAAVFLEERPAAPQSLHVASLVPGWTRQGESADTANTTEEGAAPASGLNEAPPAESLGTELDPPDGYPQTLGAALVRAAEQDAVTEIGYLQADGIGSAETYAELSHRARRIGAGLRKAGLTPGDPVVMQLVANSDFIGAFWGCVAAGGVPVPVAVPASYREDAGAIEKLLNAWELLGRGLVIADRRGAEQLQEIARGRRLGDFRTATIEDLSAFEDDGFWHSPDPEDVALMMLTSGTTGAPKAVMLSHRNLIGRSIATQAMNDMSGDDVSLNWMPLDHVAGLVYFHLRDVFLGCRQLHAPTDLVLQEPTRWLDWLEQHCVTVTFAPNFAYALVNDLADEIAARSWNLGSVRYFMNAGEAIVSATARRFLEILEPHGLARTAMLPAWGMSETSSAVTFGTTFTRDSTADGDPFVEVGAPLPGFDMRIVDGDGRVVRGETVGNLEVRGVSVTSGYFQNPEANAESFTSDGWFRTGDLALLRDGRLTVTGRTKDVIIINGINYYSHEIEKVVDDLDAVSPTFSAACAVRDRGAETDQLAIFFHSDTTDEWGLSRLLKEIRQSVVRRIGILPRYLIPVAMDTIPRTGIGKIQRPLLKKQFEAGEFEETLQRMDCLVAGPETVPAWFHRPVWIRRKVSPAAGTSGDCLVLHDSSELAEKVRTELERRGHGVVSVKPGPGFERIGPANYQVDPEEPSHFDRVLEEAAADGSRIRSIVHLWPHDSSRLGQGGVDDLRDAERHGVEAVLHLIRALDADRDDDAPRRFLAVTRRLYRIVEDEVPSYAQAALPGLTRTMSQELPWLESRMMDLTGEESDVDARHVVDELESCRVDAEAAYRHGQRWVRRLAQVEKAEFAASSPPFRRHGVYLVTGGLGGLGGQIARYLLTEFEARLILVGRRELSAEARDSDGESEDHERLKLLGELGDLPGEIEYCPVDICDADRLGRVVEAAEDRWSAPLAGVVHLAGSFHERLLLEESVESFGVAGRAKTLGTERLCELVRARPGSSFVAFSSVNAFFGGYGAGAYAAANAFLDGAVQNLIYEHGVDAYCFAWSLWDEVGMSRGYAPKEAARRRGFHIISPSRGQHSFLGALHSGQRHLVIGLDGDNSNIRPLIMPLRPTSQRLVAFVAPREAAATAVSLPIQDRFDTETRCEIRPVAAIPRIAGGEVDRTQLLGEEGSGGGDSAPPSTDLELLIAGVWKEVLGLDAIGINENFFDLGADSVTMTRAQLEIHKAVESDVVLTTLYEYPTIQRLAAYVAGAGASSAPMIEESEQRGAERRERMKRRRRRTGESRRPSGDEDG
jgi:acyl-CoA synthetase (AMP-forming)/AMP-acid ligase II/NAD(P)-dependent dehydrogenase (short-subunit alcohol dehydrogenase family)/aryl carrier-like protein